MSDESLEPEEEPNPQFLSQSLSDIQHNVCDSPLRIADDSMLLTKTCKSMSKTGALFNETLM